MRSTNVMMLNIQKFVFLSSLVILCVGLYWQHLGPKLNKLVHYYSPTSLAGSYPESKLIRRESERLAQHPKSHATLRRITSKTTEQERNFKSNLYTIGSKQQTTSSNQQSALYSISLPVFTSAIIVVACITLAKITTGSRSRDKTRKNPKRNFVPHECIAEYNFQKEEEELLNSLRKRNRKRGKDSILDILRSSRPQNISNAIRYIVADLERQKHLASRITNFTGQQLSNSSDAENYGPPTFCNCCCHSEHLIKRTILRKHSLEPLIEYDDTTDSEIVNK